MGDNSIFVWAEVVGRINIGINIEPYSVQVVVGGQSTVCEDPNEEFDLVKATVSGVGEKTQVCNGIDRFYGEQTIKVEAQIILSSLGMKQLDKASMM